MNPFQSLRDYEEFVYMLPYLASTFPHHKHIPPDIKHNRIPTSEMSFTRPNLPAVIAEVEMPIAQAQNRSNE